MHNQPITTRRYRSYDFKHGCVNDCGLYRLATPTLNNIMTKSKAQQAILNLRAKLDDLPKAKHLPKGKGFTATRTALKNKFYFLKLYKTDHNIRKLLVEQATKDIEEYAIEIQKRQNG